MKYSCSLQKMSEVSVTLLVIEYVDDYQNKFGSKNFTCPIDSKRREKRGYNANKMASLEKRAIWIIIENHGLFLIYSP